MNLLNILLWDHMSCDAFFGPVDSAIMIQIIFELGFEFDPNYVPLCFPVDIFG